MADCLGSCMKLTDEQLSSLLANGWEMVSGPHDTEEECEAVCCPESSSSSSSSEKPWYCLRSSSSSSESLVPCCGGTPAIIHVTISGGSACDGTYEMNYIGDFGNGPVYTWQCAPTEEGLRWTCSEFNPELGANNNADTYAPDSGQCNPFEWVYTITNGLGVCNCLLPSVLTVTITL